MPRITDTFRKRLRIERDDPIVPLLDSMELQHQQLIELGKRATSEAVAAARTVVIPSLGKRIWLAAICAGGLVGGVVAVCNTYFQSTEYSARLSQIEAQVNERVEKMADARAEQLATERLRTCEVNAATKSSEAQQMLFLAWSMALPGKSKSIDDARRVLSRLDERDLVLITRAATQLQRGNLRFIIGVIVKMTPSEQQQLSENLAQSGWTP
jgi:hypothetical protein